MKIKSTIVFDGKGIDALKEKYKGATGVIDKRAIKECEYYCQFSQGELEGRGFVNGKKDIWIKEIGDWITLIQSDYEPKLSKPEIKQEKILEFYYDKDLINIVFPEPEWIIENQIPLNEVGIMVGKRGERKTFTALYQAICVASGKDCFGDKVSKPRKVLFVSEEDSIIRLSERIKSLKKGLGIEKEELPLIYLTEQQLKLDTTDEKNKKFQEILQDFKPSLVIIDTLQRCVSFDADKDNQEISEFFMNFIKPLTTQYNCSWLIVHHLRKGISGGNVPHDLLDEVRGGSEIVNFPRFVLCCQVPKDSKELMVFKVLKMSYAEIPDSKVVSFSNSPEEGTKIEYVGTPDEVLANEAQCAKAIQEYLFTNQITEFKTKELTTTEASEKIGFKKSMIHSGLKFLVDKLYLEKLKRGVYSVKSDIINQRKLS